MITPKVIIPSVAQGFAIRQMGLGTDSYDLTESYPPETGIWQSKVLDLGSPKFQPNATYAFDRSRYNNHGTIIGATWVRLPSGLWVQNFDGDDKITATQNASTALVTAVTLEVWVKFDVSGIRLGGVLGRHDGTSGYLLYCNSTSTIQVYINNAKVVTITPSLGVWHHIVGTYNKVAIYGYLDSSPLSPTSLTENISSPDVPVTIGAYGNNAGTLLGVLGLARIYNQALTAAQVVQHYQREKHLFGVR